MHLETHLRERNAAHYCSARFLQPQGETVGGLITGPIPYSRSELGFLQLLYSNVDDPDSMSGVTVLRARLLLADSSSVLKSDAAAVERMRTLRERIRDLEHEGRWEDALLCYEQAIQTVEDAADCNAVLVSRNARNVSDDLSSSMSNIVAPDSVPIDDVGAASADIETDASVQQLQSGLLRCLCNVGHLETALNRAIGVARRKPALSHTVLPHAMEAAWRLCKWDSLDNLLRFDTSTSSTTTDDSSGLGEDLNRDDAQPQKSQPVSSYGFSLARCLSQLHSLSSTSTLRLGDGGAVTGAASSTNLKRLRDVPSNARVIDRRCPVLGAWDIQHLLCGLGQGVLYAAIDISGKKGVAEAVGALSTAASLFSAFAPPYILRVAQDSCIDSGLLKHKIVVSAATGLSQSDGRACFNASIAAARLDAMTSLSAASMESYSRAYPWLVRLHCLRELERSADLLHIPVATSRDNAVNMWSFDTRLAITSPSASVREAILAPRHALFRIFDLKDREAGVWLDLARLARSAGNHVAASAALLRASALGSDVASIHSAKLLYLQGHVHRALQQLEPFERNLDEVVVRLQTACTVASGMGEDRVQAAQRQCHLEAKRTLYATRWMVESRLVAESAAIARFNVVCKLHPHWEKAWFSLGKFYDTLLKASRSDLDTDRASAERRDSYVLGVIEAYCTALVHGHVHIFEALPRVLTLMFDYGAACAGVAAAAAAPSSDAAHVASLGNLVARTGMAAPQERTLELIIRRVKDMRSKMVGYRWMTALPQLMSRVCHRHKAVQSFLTSTLSAITNAFPSQALWPLIGLSKSQVPMRAERAKSVIKPYRISSAHCTQLVGVAEAMVDQLIVVASDLPPEGADRSYTLRDLVDNSVFRDCGIILPLLASLTVVLAPKSTSPHSPSVHGDGFSRGAPKIHKFERAVDVMSSKEKPKKITIVATDGKR